MPQTIQTNTPQETLALAERLAQDIQRKKPNNLAIALQGDLGAGKTWLAKGMIHQLSQTKLEDIPSPTFTLVECYDVPAEICSSLKIIYHVDLYRLEKLEELDALAWEEWFSPGALTLIEWPGRFPHLISHCQWQLKFVKESPQARAIKISQRETQ